MSKLLKIEGLAARVFELRESGEKWDAAGGIVDVVKAEFPEAGVKNAIPLRSLYRGEAARRDAERALKPTKAAVTAARDAGEGWDSIAARAGKSVADVKALYDVKKGKAGVAGRAYVSADGSLNVRLEATVVKAKPEPVLGSVAKPMNLVGMFPATADAA